MMLFKGKNIPEFEDEQPEVRPKRKSTILRDVLDGSFLTRQWFADQRRFLLFCTALAIVYIANRHHADRIYRNTLRLQEEVKELRSEKIINASELMFLSRQSEVEKMVKNAGLGLEELQAPPHKLIVEKIK